MGTAQHDSDFYFVFLRGKLYVGGENRSVNGNGAYNKSIVEAILPQKFENTRIYGTQFKCLAMIPSLKKVFVPRTYKVIETDFCYESRNVESIIFEENSELEVMMGWVAPATSIKSFSFPSNIKRLIFTSSFRNCNSLRIIYFPLKFQCNNATIFNSITPSDIKVFVRKDYSYDDFCGAEVVKVLEPPKRYITCRKKMKETSRFVLSFAICLSLC